MLVTCITRARSVNLLSKQLDDTYIDSKVIEVPDAIVAGGVRVNRLVGRQRVMFARVISVPVRVSVSGAQVSIRGHIFHVRRPADALQIQEVDDGRDVAGNVDEVIGAETEEIASDSSNVVGLAGVGHGIVAREQYALGSQILEDGVCDDCRIVGVLEPDLNEAVENLAGHSWGVGDGAI